MIEKINGNQDFKIKQDSEADFTRKNYTDEEFDDLINKLKKTHEEIKSLLISKSNEWYQETVPGSVYDYEFLIEGIIQHDIYHVGQIAYLK